MELIGIIIFWFVIQFIWNSIQSTVNRFKITLKKDVTNIDNKNTLLYI